MPRLRGGAFVVGVAGFYRLLVDQAADALRERVLDRFKIDEFGGLVDLIDHASPVETGSVFEGGCSIRVDRICDHRAETDPDPPKGCWRQRNHTPDMAIRLCGQVVPRADNHCCADLETLESSRGLPLGCNARGERVSKAIDFSDHLSDRDLRQAAVWTTLETCQTLLKDDHKASLGPKSTRMADPCVYDMAGGQADRERTQAALTGFHLDLNRVRCLNLQVVEPLGHEEIGGKIPGRQPGCQPRADRVLEMKAATRP